MLVHIAENYPVKNRKNPIIVAGIAQSAVLSGTALLRKMPQSGKDYPAFMISGKQGYYSGAIP